MPKYWHFWSNLTLAHLFVLFLKIKLKLVNFKMDFWCLQFLQKNQQKRVNLRYDRSKVEFIHSFFGRICGLAICFRVWLTFTGKLPHTEMTCRIWKWHDNSYLKNANLTVHYIIGTYFFSQWPEFTTGYNAVCTKTLKGLRQ